MSSPTDEDIRNALQEIDDMDEDVTEWESNFLDNVAYSTFPLSEAQRKAALKILEKYGMDYG